MNRERVDSQASVRPDDEVMPYSDDETDDELVMSSDGEAEHPGGPQPPGETKPSGEYQYGVMFGTKTVGEGK